MSERSERTNSRDQNAQQHSLRGAPGDGVNESLVAHVLNNTAASETTTHVYGQQPQINAALLAHRQQQQQHQQHQQQQEAQAIALAARNQHIAAHNQQVLAAAAIQQHAQQSAVRLRDTQLLDARQQIRDAQIRDAQLRDAQLRDAQLMDAQLFDAQYRDAQYLQLAQMQDAPPVMVYIPPSGVGVLDPTIASLRGARGLPEVLDLTADDHEVEEVDAQEAAKIAATSKEAKKRRTSNSSSTAPPATKRRSSAGAHGAPNPSGQSRRPFSSPTSLQQVRRVQAVQASSRGQAQAAAREQHQQQAAARAGPAGAKAIAAKPAHAQRPAVAPRLAQAASRAASNSAGSSKKNTIRSKAKLVSDHELGTIAGDILSGTKTSKNGQRHPLIFSPTQLDRLGSIVEAILTQRMITVTRKRDKTIQKQKEIIDSLRQQSSSKQKLNSKEKRKYASEIEEIRRQSEKAMRVYLKATNHAFEKLQEEYTRVEEEEDECS